jgi:hypothetical protein
VAAVALAGSAHGAIYSSENFEGGTVCYSINGVTNGKISDSWQITGMRAAAFAGTDYVPGATSRIGIVSNGDSTDIIAGGETYHNFARLYLAEI